VTELDLDPMLVRAMELTKHLAGTTIATHYGKPAIKVNGKTLANLCREPSALSVHCPLELKEVLVQSRPDVYFDTPHFSGWPAVLLRMDVIDDELLRDRLESAWQDLTAAGRTK
jgi:hypothetical protein